MERAGTPSSAGFHRSGARRVGLRPPACSRATIRAAHLPRHSPGRPPRHVRLPPPPHEPQPRPPRERWHRLRTACCKLTLDHAVSHDDAHIALPNGSRRDERLRRARRRLSWPRRGREPARRAPHAGRGVVRSRVAHGGVHWRSDDGPRAGFRAGVRPIRHSAHQAQSPRPRAAEGVARRLGDAVLRVSAHLRGSCALPAHPVSRRRSPRRLEGETPRAPTRQAGSRARLEERAQGRRGHEATPLVLTGGGRSALRRRDLARRPLARPALRVDARARALRGDPHRRHQRSRRAVLGAGCCLLRHAWAHALRGAGSRPAHHQVARAASCWREDTDAHACRRCHAHSPRGGRRCAQRSPDGGSRPPGGPSGSARAGVARPQRGPLIPLRGQELPRRPLQAHRQLRRGVRRGVRAGRDPEDRSHARALRPSERPWRADEPTRLPRCSGSSRRAPRRWSEA